MLLITQMDELSAEEKEAVFQSRRTKKLTDALAAATATKLQATKDQELKDEQARTSARWLTDGGYKSAHLGISRQKLSESVELVSLPPLPSLHLLPPRPFPSPSLSPPLCLPPSLPSLFIPPSLSSPLSLLPTFLLSSHYVTTYSCCAR